jgi:DNA-binding NarL/FixJ family response regulator
MGQPVRVVVVDDSTFMRGALVRMIEKDPRFKVVDVASNGEEGVAKVRQHLPDVVTMDVEMPIMNGIEALRAIMASTKTPVTTSSVQASPCGSCSAILLPRAEGLHISPSSAAQHDRPTDAGFHGPP